MCFLSESEGQSVPGTKLAEKWQQCPVYPPACNLESSRSNGLHEVMQAEAVPQGTDHHAVRELALCACHVEDVLRMEEIHFYLGGIRPLL